MGFSHVLRLILVLVATTSLLASHSAMANKGWGGAFNFTGSSGFNQTAGLGPWGWNHTASAGSNNYTGWWGGFNRTTDATRQGPRKIIVGGSKGWTYGFNYSEWALKNAPFYINDILVFKYDPPKPFTHSIYLLPNLKSYLTCNLKRAKKIAAPSQGAGKGFEFKIKKWQPHYFACGEHQGIHCMNGTMKFFVMPMFAVGIDPPYV